MIKPGYNVAAQLPSATPFHVANGTDLNVYSCMNDGCAGFDAATWTPASHEITSCKPNYDGLFCSACDGDYMKRGIHCELCGQVPWQFWAGFALLLLVISVVSIWKRKMHGAPDSHKHRAFSENDHELRGLQFYVRIMEKCWPRFRQSWRILVSNFQITSKIAVTCSIQWPGLYKNFMEVAGEFCNLDVLALPGLRCLMSKNFFWSWGAKMLLLPFIVLVLYIWYRHEVHKLKKLAHYHTNSHDIGDIFETSNTSEKVLVAVVAKKLRLAIALGRASTRFNSWTFMFAAPPSGPQTLDHFPGSRSMRFPNEGPPDPGLRVFCRDCRFTFLLYPSLTTSVFSLFRCRDLDGGASVLYADPIIACTTAPNSDFDPGYYTFYSLALVLLLVYPLGVPAMYAYKLYTNRVSIRLNPEYVKVVGFKPLFQFYKGKNYMWEIYFMLQKVFLLGFLSLFPTSTLHKSLNVGCCIIVLVAVSVAMPSKTQEYNYANIISQTVMIITYFATLIIAGGDLTQTGISQSQLEYFMLGIQSFMMLYLIYVSTWKLWQMIQLAKKQIAVEDKMMEGVNIETELANPRSRDHLKGNNSDENAAGKYTAVDHDEAEGIALAFKFFDQDGSKSINLCELHEVSSMAGVELTKLERRALCKYIEQENPYDKLGIVLEKELQAMGVDTSGFATHAEFTKTIAMSTQLCQQADGWIITEKNVDHVVQLMDPDGDGSFAWNEFFRAERLRRQWDRLKTTELRQSVRDLNPQDIDEMLRGSIYGEKTIEEMLEQVCLLLVSLSIVRLFPFRPTPVIRFQ